MMRKAAISLAFSMTLAGPALAQTNPVPIPAARPAPQAARPAIHPVSKSADPTFDEGTYQRISAAMLSYSSIEVRGGWPMLPAGAKLGPGSSGPEVALLKQRLAVTDDLVADMLKGDVYDAVVVDAVKRFQARHGLDETGAVR